MRSSVAQEASNFIGDELGRGHNRHMALAAQNRDSRVRDDGANPLGSFACPVGALLAEQEQHPGGELPEALGVDPVRHKRVDEEFLACFRGLGRWSICARLPPVRPQGSIRAPSGAGML